MTEKRFIEFATQQTDNGEINNGFQDIKSGEWYYTKDSENAKKICELLNELHEENKKLKQVNEMLQMDFAMTERNLMEENEKLKKELFEARKIGLRKNG